jgi:hypothetical protein
LDFRENVHCCGCGRININKTLWCEFIYFCSTPLVCRFGNQSDESVC